MISSHTDNKRGEEGCDDAVFTLIRALTCMFAPCRVSGPRVGTEGGPEVPPLGAHFGLPSERGACPRPARRVAGLAAAGRFPGCSGSPPSSFLLRSLHRPHTGAEEGERAEVPLDRCLTVARRGAGQGEMRRSRPCGRPGQGGQHGRSQRRVGRWSRGPAVGTSP